MNQVASTRTFADGRFSFASDAIRANVLFLVQAAYKGVDYNAPVRMGASQTATVDLKIYGVTSRAPPLRVSSAQFIVRAQGGKVQVEEMYALRNLTRPPVSYANPNGTFTFNLAKAAGQPTVAVADRLNMPLPQDVQPGKSPGQYRIQFPLKPGLTVVMVEYTSDYTSAGFNLADSVPYPVDQVELDVIPASLAVASAMFKPVGSDPDTGGEKFMASNLMPGEAIQASLHGASLPDAGSGNSGDETVKELPNPMTRVGWPLLGCFLLVLCWAMGVRVSREWAMRGVARPGSPAQKELETKISKLLDSVASLDELFEAGKVPEKKYWGERLELKAKLVVLLKTTPPAFIESYATRRNQD